MTLNKPITNGIGSLFWKPQSYSARQYLRIKTFRGCRASLYYIWPEFGNLTKVHAYRRGKRPLGVFKSIDEAKLVCESHYLETIKPKSENLYKITATYEVDGIRFAGTTAETLGDAYGVTFPTEQAAINAAKDLQDDLEGLSSTTLYEVEIVLDI